MTRPFLILTGLSGSGKSAAMRAFEDMGYYCVDNLPVVLIPVFADLCARSRDELPHVALVLDVRERRFLEDFPQTLANIRKSHSVCLLFFEASDQVLTRRFGETRRPHPMADGSRGLTDSIRFEREALAHIRTMADRIINTTAFSVHDLKAHIKDNYQDEDHPSTMLVLLQSFGYKYGVPPDMDLIFDVRFISNPFFVDGLKGLTGRDEAVVRFLEEQGEYKIFLQKTLDLLRFLLPLYIREGKSYLRVGIGCTGGKHRSVAVTEHFSRSLADDATRMQVQHRDMERE
ncbi:MAG: RNase adapter RapZ [Acidobacteria bacterium]|nr:RNase adapter RapZ [Acidobacteriota bacterium]